ncbi:MAG: hypothetical protein M3Q29_21795 [Chloroflexota bacterium]|nr:hypothetical protein [Chloroflexota bacterium]
MGCEHLELLQRVVGQAEGRLGNARLRPFGSLSTCPGCGILFQVDYNPVDETASLEQVDPAPPTVETAFAVNRMTIAQPGEEVVINVHRSPSGTYVAVGQNALVREEAPDRESLLKLVNERLADQFADWPENISARYVFAEQE